MLESLFCLFTLSYTLEEVIFRGTKDTDYAAFRKSEALGYDRWVQSGTFLDNDCSMMWHVSMQVKLIFFFA